MNFDTVDNTGVSYGHHSGHNHCICIVVLYCNYVPMYVIVILFFCMSLCDYLCFVVHVSMVCYPFCVLLLYFVYLVQFNVNKKIKKKKKKSSSLTHGNR